MALSTLPTDERRELLSDLERNIRASRGYSGQVDLIGASALGTFLDTGQTSDGRVWAQPADGFFLDDGVDPESVRVVSGELGEGEITDVERAQAIETLTNTPVRIAGEADASALAEFPTLDSDRTFVSRQNDRVSVTVYGTDGNTPDDRYPTLEFDDGSGRLESFVRSVRKLPADVIASNLGAVDTDTDLVDRAEDRDTRRATREAARDAADAAGVDLDAYDIGATAGGEVILQDADTGRSRRIDPAEASGGLASAIDAETSGGGFVADAADPAAGPTGSSGDGGLGGAGAGLIVLLFGALAAALGWLS